MRRDESNEETEAPGEIARTIYAWLPYAVIVVAILVAVLHRIG